MSKVIISVEVDKGKELIIKENTPETKNGKKITPASSKTLASFKTGKGSIQWSIDGLNHKYLTVEELDHNDH